MEICDGAPNFCTLNFLSSRFAPEVRRRLVSLAYGYLGSLADAEDIVQEAFLRLEQTDEAMLENRDAWMTTVVTRLAIDKLRSAQHRREVYPGEWLPEPVYRGSSAEQDAVTRSRLSIGLLYLLETLDPEARAVFVLREVFERPYREIARAIDKSEAACRQLMVRARNAISRGKADGNRHGSKADEAVVQRFIEALARGDENEVLGLLADDVVLVADGGGKVPSVLNPIRGAERLLRFYFGIWRKAAGTLSFRTALVNSGTGLLSYRDGVLASVGEVVLENGKVKAIYSVGNPDKLRTASN